MASYKAGSPVTVHFDPAHINRETSEVWRPSPRDSVFPSRSVPDVGSYPRGGIADFLSAGALSLVVDPSRNMVLSGLDQRPTRTRTIGELEGIVDGGIDFRKRFLNATEFEALRQFQGYPVQLRVSQFLETDVDINTGVSLIWPLRPGVEQPVIRSVLTIRAWLGIAVAGTSSYPLANADGSPLRWPAVLSGASARVDSSANVGALPAFASAIPSTFGAGVDAQRLANNPNGRRFPGLFQNAAGQDNSAGLNAVESVRVITSPGRVDSDGAQQPQPIGTPTIPVLDPVLELTPPTYSETFRATVVSSEINPELIDEVTGIVAERSRHTLLLDVHDRTQAGLADTPAEYNSSTFPDVMIGTRGFWVIDLEETPDERVFVRLSTRPGG